MLVARFMTRSPVTVTPDVTLAEVEIKMKEGGFRRLPVLRNQDLVGIITDRDVRERLGFTDQVRVDTAMSSPVTTVSAQDRVEDAARLMLEHRVGGLPVMDGEELVGIVTTTDVLEAFCRFLAVRETGITRIDVIPPRNEATGLAHDLSLTTRAISAHGGEILAVGSYLKKEGDRRVFYLTVRSSDLDTILQALAETGTEVVG